MSSGKYRKEHNCLNCGHDVEKYYCSYCGQPNYELKENFWTFMSHNIGHYFHFDSKFFQTLVPLLTKPGQLTLDYIAGKRARHLQPVSMYIFVSIIYFLIVPHTEKHQDRPKTGIYWSNKNELSEKDVESIIKDLKKGGVNENSFFSKEIIGLAAQSNKSFKKLSNKEQQAIIDSLKATAKISNSKSLNNLIETYENLNLIKQDSTYEAYLIRQSKLPRTERDNWLQRIEKKKEINIKNKEDKENWSLTNELQKNRSKQYFLLMPLLAFFIMISFRKNHIYYLDHLIFTIHGITALFILQIVYQPINYYLLHDYHVISTIFEVIIFSLEIWYLYTALRAFYQRPKWITIRKMFGVLFLSSVALMLSELIIKNILYVIA